MPRESEEDAKRVQLLSAEARMPSPHLTIIDSRGTVTITDADDVSRTLHTDGNDDDLQIHGVRITAVTIRESGHVVVRYKVEQGRELRYTYTRESAGPKLTVDIQFVEDGRAADTIRRVYDLIGPNDPFPAPDVTAKTEHGAAGGVPAIPPTAGTPGAAASPAPPEPFNQQPDAELKGLTRLGIVIDGLGGQAPSCGLTEAALESAVAGQVEECRLHRGDEYRRGLLRLHQCDHRQPVVWIVRLSLRRDCLDPHDRAAFVSAVAGPGRGVAPAPGRHQRRPCRRTRGDRDQERLRVSE